MRAGGGLRRPLLPALTVALAVAGGCANTSRQIAPEVLAYHEANTTRLRQSGVGVVADGCIISFGVTKTYAYRDASSAYVASVADEFSRHLSVQGVPLRGRTTPFLCGGWNDVEKTLKLAGDDGDGITEATLPIVLDERIGRDAGLTSAYSALISKVGAHTATNALVPIAESEQDIDISTEAAQALAKDIGSPLVFVVYAGGAQYSFMRKFASGVTTGLATFVLTGGYAIGIGTPQTHTGHALSLVDLDRRKLLWKSVHALIKQDPLESAQEKVLFPWPAAIAGPFLRWPTPEAATVVDDAGNAGGAAGEAPHPARHSQVRAAVSSANSLGKVEPPRIMEVSETRLAH